MQLKKQVLSKKEAGFLRFPKKKEIDRICIIAERLEAYLQLAYEENNDVEETLAYMDDVKLAVDIPITNERLRKLAASVYTHSQAIQFIEKKVYFDGTFVVEVRIRATPF